MNNKERDSVMINEQTLINIAAPEGITSSDIDVFCDKLLVLMTRLRDMGYIVHGEMDIVNIIESECLDVSQFDDF